MELQRTHFVRTVYADFRNAVAKPDIPTSIPEVASISWPNTGPADCHHGGTDRPVDGTLRRIGTNRRYRVCRAGHQHCLLRGAWLAKCRQSTLRQTPNLDATLLRSAMCRGRSTSARRTGNLRRSRGSVIQHILTMAQLAAASCWPGDCSKNLHNHQN